MKAMPFLFAWAGLIACTAPANAQESAVPKGPVELKVLAPDGRPLTNADVRIGAPFTFGQEEEPSLDARTDDRGIARVEQPLGTQRIGVTAPGVGYGQTGDFEVVRDATAHPSTAPLVPFGTIEGTVTKELWHSGCQVALMSHDHFAKPKFRAATIDADGHFKISDLRAGNDHLVLRGAKGEIASCRTVFVIPGQQVRAGFLHGDLDWERKRSAISRQPAKPIVPQSVELPKFSSYSGTVRDESGKAVVGATVFAADAYESLMSPWHRAFSVQTAMTDSKGAWRIDAAPDDDRPFIGAGWFIVHKEGHPVGIERIEDTGKREPNRPGDGHRQTDCDLGLPSRGAGLQVMVVSNGKPLENAKVHLIPSADYFFVGGGTTAEKQLRELVNPVSITDSDGVAHFDRLRPGAYTAVATAGEMTANVWEILEPPPFALPHEQRRFAVYRGLSLGSGEIRKIRLSVFRQDYQAKVQFLNPNGQPAIDKFPDLRFSRVGQFAPHFHSLDSEGLATFQFREPGLAEINCRYGTTRAQMRPIRTGQYFEGSAPIGVSTRLNKFVTVLTTRFRESGSIDVSLQDAAGKPARGYVIIGRHFDTGGVAGATDDNGRVRFEHAVALDWDYPYRIEGFIAGSKVPSVGFDDGPLPGDQHLTGHSLPYQQEFKLSPAGENHVILRAKSVGYVRGVVRPAPGSTCADYRVDGNIMPTQSAMHYNRQTGESLFGPLPEGEANLWCTHMDGMEKFYQPRHVDVRSDRVAHIEFDASRPVDAAPAVPQNPYPPSEEVRGKVLLTDGKTPAAGAVISTAAMWNHIAHPDTTPYYAQYSSWNSTFWRGHYEPFTARIDGQFEYSLVMHGPLPPYAVVDQVLIADLPGVCGAAALLITPANVHEEVSLVLPPPIQLRGTVTMGGKPIAGRDGQYVVVACYVGDPRLQGAANVASSVDDTGDFELAGLTPGKYQVQAALDGIWLSPSADLSVKREAAVLGPLRLDIGEPGVPSIVRCIGADGKPKAGVKARVVREGPLPKFLPSEFHSDGAGLIHIPPLEAGGHPLRVVGVAEDQLLTVPRITDPEIKPAEMTVTLGPARDPSGR